VTYLLLEKGDLPVLLVIGRYLSGVHSNFLKIVYKSTYIFVTFIGLSVLIITFE